MKAGWKTTEFWQTLLAQGLATLVLLGVITVNDSQTLEEALGKSVAAILALLLNGNIVGRYVAARLHLKSSRADPPPECHGANGGAARVLPMLLAALALGLLADPVAAESPTAASVGGIAKPSYGSGNATHACALLPWRARIERDLQDLRNRPQTQPAPAPPAPAPIYIVPPLQQMPIQGDPRQQLPIPGNPYQQLPIPGNPQQQLPIPGQPQQPLPVPGAPQQQLPIQGQPQQPLPYMPPVGGSPQSYTIIRALGLPIK